MKFKVSYTEAAKDDILDLTAYISVTCKAPLTSKEYMSGLFEKIKSLSHSAESFPFYSRKSFAKYGFNVRRINYKKMAIIYSIHGSVVLIQRIIQGALITQMD